ncbi:MAG: hypothetical protein ACR2PF_11125, partial [Rhizobiaceae bacterium]
LQVRPAWFDFYRFLEVELSHELGGADQISSMMGVKRPPFLAAAVAFGAHRRGKKDESRKAREELYRVDPDMATDHKQAFVRRGFGTQVA